MFKLVLRINTQDHREHREVPRSIMRCVGWHTIPAIGDSVYVSGDYDLPVVSRTHHLDDDRIDVCFSAPASEVAELIGNNDGEWEDVDSDSAFFDFWTN